MKFFCSFLSLIIFSVSTYSISAYAENESTLNELMDQWLSLESQKGKLQRDWQARSQQLEQKHALFDTEIKTLKQVLKQSVNADNDVVQRRLLLITKQDKLEQEQIIVKNEMKKANDFVHSLLSRLPPPIQKQWQEKLLLLTQKSISLSEKLERLLTLFQQVNEFNKRVAQHRSSMQIPNASGELQNLLVTQIYLGVGQGWYISDDGSYYGYGRSTSLGWYWWHGEEASAELGRKLNPNDLLDVSKTLQNPTSASFMTLPIKISKHKDVG